MYKIQHFLGSGPDRGLSPVGWGEIPSVSTYDIQVTNIDIKLTNSILKILL